jgi:hypothetical protein
MDEGTAAMNVISRGALAGKRAIVCGGRAYDDEETVFRVLDWLNPRVVAQGGASGADRLAALWCHERGRDCAVFPALWATCGRAAGPLRNQKMLDQWRPDAVVAFPGGRGTDDMVRRAIGAQVPVIFAADLSSSAHPIEEAGS